MHFTAILLSSNRRNSILAGTDFEVSICGGYMKTNNKRSLQMTVIGLFLMVSFTNCDQPGSITLNTPAGTSALASVPPNGTTGTTPSTPAVPGTPSTPTTPSCTDTIETTTENLRILFMVDNSGSTGASNTGPGTDPNDYYRTQTVQHFIQQYGNRPNLSFGFGYFSGTTGNFYDTQTHAFGSSANNVYGDSTSLTAALTAFDTLPAGGYTPYGAAFDAVQSAITKDQAVSGTKWNYVVVFMSDGYPTDISTTPSLTTNLVNLVSRVANAVTSKGNLITISTVYFGPGSDSSAIGNLQVMAQTGKGQFVNTNVSNDLVISDVISVPSHICH
jgi:Mg-chelatase subunit ChlD